MHESNDKQYEQAMNDILAIYTQAETEMLEKVSKRIAKGITTVGWNETKLEDTQKLNKELAALMKKANSVGKKKIAVEVAKGYLKGKHITYKETAEIIKSEGFKISNGKVNGNTWGKAGYFTESDEVLDFYGGLMTQKKNKGKETEVIEQYIKLGKTKEINLKYGSEAGVNDISAFYGSLHHDNMYIEAAKQLDEDAKEYFFEQIKSIKPMYKTYISKETGVAVNEWDMTPEQKSNKSKYFIEKPNYYVGTDFDKLKKAFNDTVKKFKYDTLQIKSDNGYVGYDQTVVLNSKSLVSKEEAEHVVEEAIEKMSYEQLLEEAPIPMNLKQLVKATNGLLDNASSKILRNANDVYQRIMANGTTGLLAGVDTRIQATQKMLNEYAAKGITTFVDKAGRNWSLSSYAEMCARTVSSHAALQGHIERQNEVGEDLVKVSTIGTTCPICQRWQGVVLSISGNSPKYHSLDEAKASGLFHPNCKHTLVMYIPELDDGTEHEGKIEPGPIDMNTQSSKRNALIEQQRANERKIRYWKNRKALAITPEEESKCNDKIRYWQHTNLLHCQKNNLRRQYAREGVMSGKVTGPTGTFIGGNIKEFEKMYEDVVGEKPKKAFNTIKYNLQFFGGGGTTYDKWLKDEIETLDQLDIDKAMMKDANNKAVTPTSLYKKYIGDNPMQDYAQVAEFEKGTKEFKSQYAKWLKKQIEEIGVSYKVKPKYTEVHEEIPEEDTKLSATEIYKKYHDGKAPTQAYKDAGGEEGTGMKYGKWVETQKKELIKNGITKKVPFSNSSVQKNNNTIAEATSTINASKDALKTLEYNKYLDELNKTVHGNYDGYLAVKAALEEVKSKELYTDANEKADYEFAVKKLKAAESKHLEFVKKKAEKAWASGTFDKQLLNLNEMLIDEDDEIMHAHIYNQIQEYNKVQESEMEKEAKKAEEKKKQQEAEASKQKEKLMKSSKVTIGREVRINEGHLVEQSKIYNELDLKDLENLSSQVYGHSLFEANNRRDILGRDRFDGHNHHMGHDVRLKSGLSPEDKKLGEAFQIAYNDYFNTIKCQDINLAYLKGYDNASSTMKKKIDALRTCIQSSELNEPIVVHRFVDNELMEAIFKTSDVHSLRPGSLYENNTFMSAATGGHPTFGKRNYMITIQCDKGTHALPTLNHEELEVLLDKGKLEVVDAKSYTSSKPRRLQNYDGSYTNFVGDEVVVRYVETGKDYLYEEVTPEKIDSMLGDKAIVSKHTKESEGWIESLSSSERKASKRYTGSWFVEMNDVYRRDDRSDDEIVKYSEDLTNALRRATTNQPVVLRRGVNPSDLAHMLGFQGNWNQVKEHWDEINEGGYAAEDKGFLSTSPFSKGGFDKSVELRIYCPTGTHAAYVDSISSNKGEKETLLESGSIYKVLKLAKEGSRTIAYLELLGTD